MYNSLLEAQVMEKATSKQSICNANDITTTTTTTDLLHSFASSFGFKLDWKSCRKIWHTSSSFAARSIINSKRSC
uniref:Ovule protein n=1 Tax=Globodera pallida TaxID=36090 RepID=A0A183BWL6_GLOPA